MSQQPRHHVFRLAKEQLLAGLFWQTLPAAGDRLNEIRSLGSRLGFDHYVEFDTTGLSQVGFAAASAGAHKGCGSLAVQAALAVSQMGVLYDGHRQSAPSWLGVFKLDANAWWYVAVRDFSVLPNGDFVGSREAVVARLLDDHAVGGWNAVLGDESLSELGLSNFEARDLGQLLVGASRQLKVARKHRLSALKAQAVSRPALVAAALCVVVLAGAGSWFMLQPAPPRATVAVKEVAAPPPLPPAPREWRTLPTPSSFVAGCLSAFGHLAPGGWPLVEFSCDGGAQFKWKRDAAGGGTMAHLLTSHPGASVELSGMAASASVPLVVSGGERNEDLHPQGPLLAELTSGVQLLELTGNINKRAVPPPAPGSAAPDWSSWTFSLSLGHLSPQAVLPVLEKPGVRLRKLLWKDGAGWSIEGVIYAK